MLYCGQNSWSKQGGHPHGEPGIVRLIGRMLAQMWCVTLCNVTDIKQQHPVNIVNYTCISQPGFDLIIVIIISFLGRHSTGAQQRLAYNVQWIKVK